MASTALLTTALTGGIVMPDYHYDLVKTAPLAWFEGGLDSNGLYVERMSGRRWAAIDTLPAVVTVGTRKVLQFTGLGGLRAADGADTLTSTTDYSVVTVTRFTNTTTGGGAVVATDMSANQMLDYVSGSDGSDGFFGRNGSGTSLIADPTDITDGAVHTTIVSVTPGDNVMRRDGYLAASNALTMTLAGGAGSQRLLIGAGKGSTAYDYLRLNGGQIALILLFNRAIHKDAQALATVQSYCNALSTALSV